MARKNPKPKHDPNATEADNKSKSKPDANSKKASRKKSKGRNEGWRETVEGIVVAFILAFLFRTFEAEAFVIPTGSMAPTLLGRHKDVTCEQCGYHFAVGASDELDKASGGLAVPSKEELGHDRNLEEDVPHRLIGDAVCPNCRHITLAKKIRQLPAHKGDRILVNKYPYEFGEPQRWDVVVFKFPEEPQTAYIKRLVGLPGESLEIHQGDVYARKRGEERYHILRKDDPDKQNVLQILVNDNDHAPKKLLNAGFPERWSARKRKPDKPSAWTKDDAGWKQDGRTFSLSGGDSLRWLRYRHIVPTKEQWHNVLNDKPLPPARPRLIGDFCGYNAYLGGDGRPVDYGPFWVGDLTLRCEVNIAEAQDQGEFVLELNEGYRFYRCTFDLKTGGCTIARSLDEPHEDDPIRFQEFKTLGNVEETRMKNAGNHTVTFANVDNRLCVWVDGDLVDFGTTDDGNRKGVYDSINNTAHYQRPTNADLAPVGIAAKNCKVTVSHLVLKRDIYYRAEQFHPQNPHGGFQEQIGSLESLQDAMHDPDNWWKNFVGNDNGKEWNNTLTTLRGLKEVIPRHDRGGPAFFAELGDDEFFMMGDNSPRSLDSRLWPNYRGAEHRHAVPRHLLVGKAFFIYWPHGIPFLRDGQGFAVRYHRTSTGKKTDYPSFRVPFYPNFQRMHRIR